MDLKAYEQINEYEQLLRENNIEIPRLRGIDSCAIMEPWTKEEIRINKAWISAHTCEDLCTAKPFWSSNPECYELSEWTDYLKQFYMVVDKNNDSNKPNEIRWNRIHGWKRRVLKTKIHNDIRKFEKYVDTWNKYCGEKDALRIHARIGGVNWGYYGGAEISKQPWFIEKVDDYFDSTYCDIYVRVKSTDKGVRTKSWTKQGH